MLRNITRFFSPLAHKREHPARLFSNTPERPWLTDLRYCGDPDYTNRYTNRVPVTPETYDSSPYISPETKLRDARQALSLIMEQFGHIILPSVSKELKDQIQSHFDAHNAESKLTSSIKKTK